jgi:hypothetical protein
MRDIIGGEEIPRRDKPLKLQGPQAALFNIPADHPAAGPH